MEAHSPVILQEMVAQEGEEMELQLLQLMDLMVQQIQAGAEEEQLMDPVLQDPVVTEDQEL